MTSLLFLAPHDVGETVLALGALERLSISTGAQHLRIDCPEPARALFRVIPGAEIFTQEEEAPWRQIIAAAAKPFDVLFDLRGALSTLAVRAKRRFVLKQPRALRHLTEDYAEAAGLSEAGAVRIAPDAPARAAASRFLNDAGPLLVLSPGDASLAARWPVERFAAIARRLVAGIGPLCGAQLVILGTEHDRRITAALTRSLDADGVPARDAAGELDLLGAAALLERATLFIGNDGPLLHISAAMGVTSLGLFGPTDERVRGPLGARTAALRARPFADIMSEKHAALEPACWMTDISVDAVEETAQTLVRAGGVI